MSNARALQTTITLLGWQGGTLHQVLSALSNLQNINSTTYRYGYNYASTNTINYPLPEFLPVNSFQNDANLLLSYIAGYATKKQELTNE